ncbi:MAG: multidrug effflux MFS transporter [Arenicellales bacterium]
MPKPAGFREFVALMALSMSMVALAIDAMLPALSQIASDLNVAHDNDRQLVITVLFIGLAIGQIFYGPISDSVGRRAPIYVGFAMFIAGSLIAGMADSFAILLTGRFLQGLGAAGPRIITVAIIRDHSSGREMARVMSLVMMVFILVPAIAPALGQVILLFAEWRMIFLALMLQSVIILIWFHVRQEETLPVEKRRPFSLKVIWQALVEISRSREAVIYTLCAGMIFGAFVGFLNSSQQILQELYGLGVRFPLYFAILALTIGLSSWINSRLVTRLGMRMLSKIALWFIAIIAGLFLLVCMNTRPSLLWVMLYLMASFFGTGILFGNLNSLAMEPLGHIAGLASSVIGSVTTLVSLSLGFLIGGLYNYTLIPMVAGFGLLSFAALILIHLASDRSAAATSSV